MKILGIVLIALFVCAQSAIAMPSSVEVTLGASQKPVSELVVYGPLQICASRTISLGEGRYLLKLQNGLLQLTSNKKNYCSAPHLTLKGLRNGYLKIERGRSIRTYSGVVLASVSNDKIASDSKPSTAPHLMLVNRVSKADYIAGVCGAELPRGARLEAIKAQAVLANNIVAHMETDARIDDTTQNAAYMGVVVDRPELKVAVKAVGDTVLLYNKRPIHPYFHSTCAGRTSRGCDIFKIDKSNYAYLESVECHYCQKSPFWKHTVSVVPWSNYVRVFGLCNPTIDKKDEAGRALDVSVGTARVAVSGYNFWTKLGQNFGWNVAPGNILSLKRKGDYLEVESRGGGHGVGMCQWGAMGLAEEGKTHVEILHHYFPHAQMSRL